MRIFSLSRLLWAGLLVVALSLSSCTGSSGGSPQVGKPAPDFTLPLLDGGTVTLSELRGKPVLINFWATWCPACRVEMPHLQGAYDDLKGVGLVLLAVDIGEDAATVRQFMQQGGYIFPIPMDTRAEVSKRYNVQAFPTSFVVDCDGIIRGVKVGAFRDKDEVMSEVGGVLPGGYP